MEIIKDFVKPELLIIVPVLYILSNIIKKSKMISDRYIPLILGTAGVVLATSYSFATSVLDDYKSVIMCLFSGITQGLLCAGLSVYTNHFVVTQQCKCKDKKNNNDSKQ